PELGVGERCGYGGNRGGWADWSIAAEPPAHRLAPRRPTRNPVGAQHDHGPDLHQVAPCLGDAAFGRPRYLSVARLAAELPEEFGDLHEACRRDRVPDAEQAAAGAAR